MGKVPQGALAALQGLGAGPAGAGPMAPPMSGPMPAPGPAMPSPIPRAPRRGIQAPHSGRF